VKRPLIRLRHLLPQPEKRWGRRVSTRYSVPTRKEAKNLERMTTSKMRGMNTRLRFQPDLVDRPEIAAEKTVLVHPR